MDLWSVTEGWHCIACLPGPVSVTVGDVTVLSHGRRPRVVLP
jgi:hypothetical protein